jgi:biofilm PGA synthesis N-glycosyltransferase PgaC
VTILAITALALLVYTYAGYPLIVAALAHLRPLRQEPSRPREPTVSLCIAVHNGAHHLRDKLDSILDQDYPPEKLEVLVYSDGSTDDTDDTVRDYAARDPRIKLLRSERRIGKPTALNQLRRAAHGEILLMTDVRQPLGRQAVRELVRPLADSRVGCVSGNLVLRGAAGSAAYWRYEKLIRRSEAELGALVGVSGCLYAIRREDFPELPRDLILDDMWVPLTMLLKHKRVVFCESAEAYDDAFDDDREFSRKVRTLAGNYQLMKIMPRILLPSNPAWFPLLSHKVARLVCPWALIALLLSSVLLALGTGEARELGQSTAVIQLGAWQFIVSGQLLFYLLALLGSRAGRLGTVARTFVVLNVAAVVGLLRYARGVQQITW